MTEGVKSEIGNNQLMTFHPAGARSSSMDFHYEPWLDFNSYQSGPQKDEIFLGIWPLGIGKKHL